MSILVRKQDGIATVTLNRPDKLNALSEEMYHGIADHFVELDADDEVRAIVLTGAGRAFCAGGDVGSMGGYDVVTGRKRSQKHKRTIVNVFTEPEWRRRGVAKLLMEQIISWARAERLDRLVLHASDEGRALYEQMGFIQTNEMRFKDRLDLPEVRQCC